MGFKLYAIWAMREALEDYEEDYSSAAKLDVFVPPSTMWVRFAGEKIYANRRSGSLVDSRGIRRVRDRDGSKGKEGFVRNDGICGGLCIER